MALPEYEGQQSGLGGLVRVAKVAAGVATGNPALIADGVTDSNVGTAVSSVGKKLLPGVNPDDKALDDVRMQAMKRRMSAPIGDA